ncbi:phosphohydrolase [Clostridium acetobutylicum]|nr:phosphohydrolase [Clostridium acetobutylicum]
MISLKSRKKLIAIAVGVTVIMSSATALGISTFANSNNNAAISLAGSSGSGDFSDIVLSPGSDPSQLNFNWYSNNSNATPTVEVALKSDANGSDFPTNKCSTFTGKTSQGNLNFTSNKVSVSGLKPSSQYVYRLGDGSNWSSTYTFTTHDTSQYSFLFAGDPQIGASGDIVSDGAGWKSSLDKMTGTFSDTSFLISLGDQVNNGKELNGQSNETEYSQYFAPDEFKSLPVASIAGNHETYGVGHNTHFNAPNLSNTYGAFSSAPTTGTDYYFTYGNTLYLMLNSNDMNEAEHEAFIKDAINKNPNVTWKVAVLHHSVYSSADHETDTDIIQRRSDLPPIFDEFGIDVVLDGHDHCYTRSYQMKGGQALKDQTVDKDGRIINPKGTLYITANSASGSKYYEMKEPNQNNYYEAKKEQLHEPTVSRVSVTSNSFKIDTYRTDTMTQTDSYTLVKSSAPAPDTQSVINSINNLPDPTSISLNDDANVQNALNAYNSLTPDQKQLVSNADKLTQDINKIQALKASAANSQAANDVIPKINTIPNNVTLNDEGAITTARSAYNALTDPQKALVTNYSKLTDAETALAKLKAPADANTNNPNSSTPNSSNSTSSNQALSSLPKTGEFFDATMLLSIALICLASGAVLIFVNKKKSSPTK